MSKKGFIKLSLLSLIFLAVMTVLILHVIPSVADVNPGDLGYGCEGDPCPAWVNITKGDMFFADGNQVFIVVNYTCNETSVCNESMTVTGDFSDIGGSSNVVGVFKENATDGSWAIFELNGTVDFSTYPGSVPFGMTDELIYLNATDGNTSNDYFNDELNVSVFLVNMSYPSGCPPPSEPLPPQIPLLNGTLVDIGACWVNCTVEDKAQIMNATHYAICGPSFGGDTTNLTALADTGNFSNFNFVIHIPGKVKVNFTQNISANPSICGFPMNTMVGPYFGINDTAWDGTTKPNLNISAIITFYNVTERFGFQGRPQIFRYPHGQTIGVPCPPSICSDFVWDGENITFSVTSFSDYGMTDAINVTLETPSNLSYVNTNNINFTFTPEWNSSANLHNCTLYGNFTGAWGKNETTQTVLVNGVVNGINNTVASDGTYFWNVYCYNDSSQYDFYVINWTVTLDTVKPNWFTNISLNPANYSSSTLSQFNVTWNDTDSDIDTVLITIRNSTAVLISNASMLNDTYNGSIYNFSIVLPAGTFNWTSYANDSAGNWNSTDTWNFSINKSYNLALSINITPSSTVTYPTETNVTGIETNLGDSDVTYKLLRGSAVVDSTIPYQEVITLSAGTYTYKFNASSGQNWTANSTGVTATLTVQGDSFTPGGGGGEIPVVKKVTRTKGKANITIQSIGANRTTNITILKTEDLAIRKISLSVKNAVNNIKIMITKLVGMPATISHEISGKVYHYINIEKENITDADINRTIIKFAVNRTWLTNNNINYSNISLYRWENTWNELPTYYSNNDSFEMYYEAESPGFSIFTIGTSGGAPEVEEEEECTENWSCTEWSDCVNGTQTRTCTDANNCGTTVNKPLESQACETMQAEVEEFPIVTVAAVVILLVLVIVALIVLKTRGKISLEFLEK